MNKLLLTTLLTSSLLTGCVSGLGSEPNNMREMREFDDSLPDLCHWWKFYGNEYAGILLKEKYQFSDRDLNRGNRCSRVGFFTGGR
jgi:hypothetical protein